MKPIKISLSYDYELKGWNENSRPKPDKAHPWKKRNQTLTQYSQKQLKHRRYQIEKL